jgi:hypothetical protein
MLLNFKFPARFAVDQAGNVAVAGSGPDNSTVIFDPSGNVAKRLLLRRGAVSVECQCGDRGRLRADMSSFKGQCVGVLRPICYAKDVTQKMVDDYRNPIPINASTPFILGKSRKRRSACTDLCGGRPAMVVPSATTAVSAFFVKINPGESVTPQRLTWLRAVPGPSESPGVRPSGFSTSARSLFRLPFPTSRGINRHAPNRRRKGYLHK